MKSLILFTIIVLLSFSNYSQQKYPLIQLTDEPAQQGFPDWSPDGTKIAFTSTRSGHFNIWMVEVDIEELRN